MARFVLLYVKDDAHVDPILERFDHGDVKAKVVGVYKDPQHRPCECGPDEWRHNRMWGINRNFGWPVHKGCGRISPNWRRSYGKRMFQVFGKNLLPLDKTPRIFRDWKQEMENVGQ